MASIRSALLVLFLVVASTAALATPTAAETTSECQTWISNHAETTFNVETSLTLGEGEYFVIERQAFSRYWWRGRTTDNFFADTAAPLGAASISYRLSVKTKTGKLVRTVPCPIQPSWGCFTTPTATGGYEVAVEGLTAGQDAVVRRRVTDDGAYYWRGLIDGGQGENAFATFTDIGSPTGDADYVVWIRTDRRITDYYACPIEVLCPGQIDLGPSATLPRTPLNLVSIDSTTATKLGIPDTALEAQDGNYYFVRDNQSGFDDIVRTTPDGKQEVLSSEADYLASGISFVDLAGGVVLGQWGGGSRTSQIKSIDPGSPIGAFWGESDDSSGTEPLFNLPDGRVLVRSWKTDPWDGLPDWSVYQFYDPFTKTVVDANQCIQNMSSLRLGPDGLLYGIYGNGYRNVSYDLGILA